MSTKKVTKKKEPLNLNLAELSLMEGLAFPVVNENLKNKSLIYVILIQALS